MGAAEVLLTSGIQVVSTFQTFESLLEKQSVECMALILELGNGILDVDQTGSRPDRERRRRFRVASFGGVGGVKGCLGFLTSNDATGVPGAERIGYGGEGGDARRAGGRVGTRSC